MDSSPLKIEHRPGEKAQPQAFTRAKDLEFGLDPRLDAWILHFMTENNLEHALHPELNASTEQLRFMIVLGENEVFFPCPDDEFRQLFASGLTPDLLEAYKERWRHLVRFVHAHISDRYLRQRIVSLCRHKFYLVRAAPFIIPDRLMKRFLTIFLTQTSIEDPLREEKMRSNARAEEFINSQVMQRIMQECPSSMLSCSSIEQLRWRLDLEELKRLLCLSTWESLWGKAEVDEEDLLNGDAAFAACDHFEDTLSGSLGRSRLKILYLVQSSGAVLFDIQIIKALLRQGHRVTLALKEGFYLSVPTFWDQERDAALARALEGAFWVTENIISKNDLLKHQREHPLLIISDGTRERLNLCRTSVTFARSWKEADLIIAKGKELQGQLLGTAHEFTRDILCIYRDGDGRLQVDHKAKSPQAVKFTENQLLAKAEEIIAEMRQAKASGQRVMFYSAIIGSIPGQTKTALRILNTFVSELRRRLDDIMIINPGEHFEAGMDADDLMYMWERVQSSGLIDIWRFQSVEDIETSFTLLGEKVPPVWVGKDATFSTGCTQEMEIALDMQKRYPEMQIIGPDREKFFRRREYGVGKFFDAAINGTTGIQR